ncbi:hypothetical protein FACS1894170_11070 [Planctomycetales bacterium]|nr:hypothetical protein FACS1894170_11070 [Planctomycetales bacterium]
MVTSPSHINNYANVFGVQKNMSVEQLANTLPSNVKSGVAPDTLSISAPGNMMQQMLNLEMQGNSGPGAENAELDMTGLTQLKQRGEMLSAMLKMKMQNFQSNLMSNVNGNVPSEMNLKQGDDGLSLLNDMPNKDAIEKLMKNGSPLQTEFQGMSQLASVLQMLQQTGNDASGKGLTGASAQYAQQALPTKMSGGQNAENFVLQVMQSGTNFSFE